MSNRPKSICTKGTWLPEHAGNRLQVRFSSVLYWSVPASSVQWAHGASDCWVACWTILGLPAKRPPVVSWPLVSSQQTATCNGQVQSPAFMGSFASPGSTWELTLLLGSSLVPLQSYRIPIEFDFVGNWGNGDFLTFLTYLPHSCLYNPFMVLWEWIKRFHSWVSSVQGAANWVPIPHQLKSCCVAGRRVQHKSPRAGTGRAACSHFCSPLSVLRGLWDLRTWKQMELEQTAFKVRGKHCCF